MKRIVSWGIVAAGIVALVAILRTGNQEGGAATAADKKAAAKQAAAAQPAEAKKEDKVIYTFQDDAKMKEFTDLWRQRQGIVLRISVLQAYWNEEQTTLGELNKKFSSEYNLDVTKNYVLDDVKKILIERDLPAKPADVSASTPGGQGGAGAFPAEKKP